jgi:copper chaperone
MMENTVVKVGGMSCGGCVKSVTAALQAVAGVRSAEVSLQAGEAKVDYDPSRATRAELVRAVEEAGFDAS